ncbi:BLUF domain-containing protein [Methylibium rhizosphaerae]|uniref:BLUF domain-containing protein n=1 Tax=Methylibium rhizosphaerae TaxID=2570323 RepID=UPI0015E47CC6|nr:BLUF domain-containing protein [Methylibium rhizosphaerae]
MKQLLCISSIADGTPAREIARIAATSRRFNQTAAITGTLVFDGASFCHYLEGPDPALEALLSRLAADPRHERFAVLFEARIEARRFDLWRMGYALPETQAVRLDELRKLSGEAALQQWLLWLPSFELGD